MTAEVAVLNKNAVALAADSAMTTEHGKIYPANKLFALTKHHPVGVMVYSNAEFMGVPWETLVKMYRKTLGKRAFSTCQEYVQDFLSFIGQAPVRKKEQEVANLKQIALATYGKVRNTVNREIAEVFQRKRRVTLRDESNTIKAVANAQLLGLAKTPQSKSMEAVNVSKLLSNHESVVNECIDRVFRGLTLPQLHRNLLHRILKLTINSNAPTSSRSGLVIAGFGEDEMFPTLFQLTTDGIIGQRLKFEIEATIDVERQGSPGYVMAFAQHEMVQQFMEGVDPDYLDYSVGATQDTMVEFGMALINALGLSDPKMEETVLELGEKLAEKYHEEAMAFRQKELIGPTMSAVSHLPIEELAGMAEALVSLTSLKRRVSLSQETVGGPIDVAIISKGDGLIWIKRKHYFEPRLNPSYFDRQVLDETRRTQHGSIKGQ